MVKDSWKAANKVAGKVKCEICGKRLAKVLVHRIDGIENTHLAVCLKCYKMLNDNVWAPCGCGG
jgi:ribosome-binding protein aMBF1 (putative translation factor)